MGWSKSTRIIILLAIDSAFFLLELSVGYAVHSLALVADAFHMLNDVLSLCVGLWAVKVANERSNSKFYTYGWQRAETLGALINGVFLVALCVSIFLEAIQRFVEPQEVNNPKLILIVGCFGLLSNILGLFLFHDHSHGGGGHDHSHGHGDAVSDAEEGHAHTHAHPLDRQAADQGGNIADVLPENRIAGWPKTEPPADPVGKNRLSWSQDSTAVGSNGSPTPRKRSLSKSRQRRRRSISRSRARLMTAEDIPIRPASFRNEIIIASRPLEDITSQDGTDESEEADEEPTEESPLLNRTSSHDGHDHEHGSGQANGSGQKHERHNSWHNSHWHNKPKDAKGGGHGHGHDLNMKGVFLHVMGDALGNIGVIGAALFIWLTPYWWRFYSDPLISLIITVIILCSAIPLCKAASRILLQAVPAGINVDEIKEDIEDLPGIVGCHHLHVWQLSDTKLIASLHVQVDFNFEGHGSEQYMQLAQAVRTCLHEYGIHSSTIQPEFCLDANHVHDGSQPDHSGNGSAAVGKKPFVNDPEACLLECGDECEESGQCCARSERSQPTTPDNQSDNHSDHSHHSHSH